MSDKLDTYFSENNFDWHQPALGHDRRFEKKLNQLTPQKSQSWKWMSVAASILLMLGFWIGSYHQTQINELSDVSPKMKEVERYFIAAINEELKSVESQRSLETEVIIEEALDQIEELSEEYQFFLIDLRTQNNPREIINAMIKNYQQRLEILENLLDQINIIKNPKIISNEIFS